jgi:hypothetical protein
MARVPAPKCHNLAAFGELFEAELAKRLEHAITQLLIN